MITEATIKLNVENQMVHTAAEGDGPFMPDNALRALENLYPQLKESFSDYKVRVLNEKDGTAAKIRF